jgi:rhodanese-related sulfurtransferase
VPDPGSAVAGPRPLVGAAVVAGVACTACGAELLGPDGVCASPADRRSTSGRPTVDDLLVTARARIRRCTPDEAVVAMQRGALLVDTRSDADRARDGVAPGSVHVPLSVLPWRADPASEHRDPRLAAGPLLLICTDGFSSSLAACWLVDLGLDVTDVIGGFRAWLAAALPVEPAPPD